MLGFRSISGSPYRLLAYTAAMAATGALTFSGSAVWGAYMRASATGTLIFGGSAAWATRNALAASGALTVGGNALLRVAGRPFVFYAIPERLTFTGIPDRYSFTGQASNYNFRGMR